MPAEVTCGCGRKFVAGDQFIGKLVKCPGCSLPVEVPRAEVKKPSTPAPSAPSAPSATAATPATAIRRPPPLPGIVTPTAPVTEPVQVDCGCGKSFKVGPQYVGKLIKCPGCGMPLEVVGPEAIPEVEDVEIVEEQAQEEEPKPPQVLDEEEEGGTYSLNAEDAALEPAEPAATAALGTLKGAIGTIELGSIADCLALSPQGMYGLAATGDYIHVLDTKNFKRLFRFKEHTDVVTAMAFTPDSKFALSGDRTGRLIYWQVEKGEKIKRVKAHRSSIRAVAVAADGKHAVTGGADGTVHLWELPELSEYEIANASWDVRVNAVAFAPDNKLFVAGGDEGMACLWNIETGKRVHKFKRAKDPIESVAFADNGSRAVAAGLDDDGDLIGYQWSAIDGRPIPSFTRPSRRLSSPSCLTLAPNGLRIVAGAIRDRGEGDWEVTEYSSAIEGLAGGTSHGGCVLEIWTIDGGNRAHALEDEELIFGRIELLTVGPESKRALACYNTGILALWGLPI